MRIPEDAEPGTYSARALAYYDTNKLLDADMLTIVVRECESQNGDPDGSDGADGDSDVIIIEPITQPPQPSEPSEPVSRDGLYFWLLVALNVIVIIIVIAFIIRLLTR